jgi:hypothetical protein
MGLCRVLEADPLLRTGALVISTGRVNKVAGVYGQALTTESIIQVGDQVFHIFNAH